MDAYVQATQGGEGSATMILAMLKRIKSIPTHHGLNIKLELLYNFFHASILPLDKLCMTLPMSMT